MESDGVKGTGKVGYGSNISDNISKEIKELDKEINRLKIEGNDKEVKRLTREKINWPTSWIQKMLLVIIMT